VQQLEIHHFVYQLGTGGAEYVAINLATSQRASGHQVLIWTAGKPPEDAEGRKVYANNLTRLEGMGIRVIAFPYGPRSIIRNALFLRKQLHKDHSNNIIFHTHSPVSAGIIFLANVGCQIFSVHSTNFNFPVSWLRILSPRVKAFVSGAPSVAEALSSALGRSVMTIRYGVEIPIGRRQFQPSHSSGKVIFVFIGRLVPQKNPVRLLKAFSVLLEKSFVDNVDIRLKIVGDGPLMEELIEMSDRLGLSSSVEFTGTLSDFDSVLMESDFLVMSSDFEGLPIVLLRAIALGVPAILTPFPSAVELMDSYNCGVVCVDFSFESLATAMSEVISKSWSGHNDTDAAILNFKRFREEHSLESIARAYMNVYLEILDRVE